MTRRPAHLVLRDGTEFAGVAVGAEPDGGLAAGEFVFNTALSGYQEVITDPSYAGQVICFTYPHIGNYGVCADDDEATRPHCRGLAVRELTAAPSSWRAERDLESWLIDHGVAGVAGVDTRRLTRHLRRHGAVPGVFGPAPIDELRDAARTAVGTDGLDLASAVSTREPYRRGSGDLHVVAIDYGIKSTMVRQLSARFRVTVVPSSTSAAAVGALDPDGVFLSNGPGDPAALKDEISAIDQMLGRWPIFGICLGHQLLASALGATTYKLAFGHHGSNHPVKDLASGRVEITAQNHNYAVAGDSLNRAVVTHVNLNDGVIEGLADEGLGCFSVQYHPEAGPGPHDARYLFERFESLMRSET